jgi:hypothetical protein
MKGEKVGLRNRWRREERVTVITSIPIGNVGKAEGNIASYPGRTCRQP